MAQHSLIIELTYSEDGLTTYPHIWTDWSQVTKDSNGDPVNPTINAEYMPSVNITSSGTNVAFTLNFSSGQAYLTNPAGRMIKKPFDMTDWIYGIDIDLHFVPTTRDDLHNGIAVPEKALKQLEAFTTDQFSVSSLFMDFQSTNLIRYNPEVTSVGKAGAQVENFFASFMNEYLGDISQDKTSNPYILGYASKLSCSARIHQPRSHTYRCA